MSVQILSRGHLKAIIHYAFMIMGRERRVIYTGHRAYRTDGKLDMAVLMQELHEANIQTWNNRYPDDKQEPEKMSYTPNNAPTLPEIRIIAACDRLIYNITGLEHDMREALSAIKQYAVEHLPGYADAPADEGDVEP